MMLAQYSFLIVCIKAYVVGVYLNCFYKEVDTNSWTVTYRLRNSWIVGLYGYVQQLGRIQYVFSSRH